MNTTSGLITPAPQNIVVIGASGAIGQAMTQQLSAHYPQAQLHSFSRTSAHPIDYHNEDTIVEAAQIASRTRALDLVLVATGLLHDTSIMPEKSLKELSAAKFQHLFQANSITPALIAKHFLPHLNKTQPARFAALSARVGSISDNRLGGWYAYRASKAALNMILKNAAIETRRVNKQAIIVGLHPGTVDSDLSKPFQHNVPEAKLFTPTYSAQQLLQVLARLTPEHSGQCFAWDGQAIAP